MYLQEPSTPLKPTKKRGKKNGSKAVDDQVAEFMAFESHDFEGHASAGTNHENWLVIYEAEEQTTCEDSINNWLTNKGVIRDSVENVKFNYFNSKKDTISKVLECSYNDQQEMFSPITSPQNIHWFMLKSKLGGRRQGFGTEFTYGEEGGFKEELTIHKFGSVQDTNFSQHKVDITETRQKSHSSSKDYQF